jgi:hypothetical protein
MADTMDMLQGFGDLFNVGEPSGAGGLKVFPLFPTGPVVMPLRTLREVVALGGARVEETDPADGAWFRALSLVNESAQVVLVSDGDLLTAGRQDRLVDTPRAVRPGARVTLQVSCVEAGRSSSVERADLVAAERAAEPAVRRRRLLRSMRGERPDQQETWEHVAELRGARGHRDGAGSLAERSGLDERAAETVRRLPAAYGATGVAVARNTSRGARMVLLEWFADPVACASAWGALVHSVAMEVHAPTADVTISRTELRRAVARAASAVVREEAFAEGDRVAWVGGTEAMTGCAVALGKQLVNVALVG